MLLRDPILDSCCCFTRDGLNQRSLIPSLDGLENVLQLRVLDSYILVDPGTRFQNDYPGGVRRELEQILKACHGTNGKPGIFRRPIFQCRQFRVESGYGTT